MRTPFRHASAVVVFLLTASLPQPLAAQLIDFETLPGGGGTVDLQEISDQYASLGVRFKLLDPVTGDSIGLPLIAKAGDPLTAFEGCIANDTPNPIYGLGSSSLTDGASLGVDADLCIVYDTPVAQASGVVLDIDCRTAGGPPCEAWTVTAYSDSDSVLASVVLTAPQGSPNPACLSPQAGPGDGEAFGWAFSLAEPKIKSIVLAYSGTATNVGLAFDNFNASGLPSVPGVTVSTPVDSICAGEALELVGAISGGLPPFTYQWQEETLPALWTNLGNASNQDVQPFSSRRYRLTVTDALAREATSAPLDLEVLSGTPLCTTSLLVSSSVNNSVVRYSFQSGLPQVFVASGAGGLNQTSRLVCRGDGYLYVTSQGNDRVLRYDAATGAFADIFVAGGSGGLDVPVGIAFGPDQNLYVASAGTNTIHRYDGTTGAFIDIFVPNGSGLNTPTGLVFGADDDLYVCSRNSHKVLRFDGATGAPLGDFVTAASGGLNSPRGLTFGPDGHLYVAEEINDSVRRYDGTTGAFIDVFVTSGSGGLDRANDVIFGPDGHVYVPSFNNDKLLVYDGGTGAFLYELANEPLNGPAWVAVGCESYNVDVPLASRPHSRLTIEPNIPNPFSPYTTVVFTLPQEGRARVTVVDISGRNVATLVDRDLRAGRHTVRWDARSADGRVVPAGMYFLRVRSGQDVRALKMLRVR